MSDMKRSWRPDVHVNTAKLTRKDWPALPAYPVTSVHARTGHALGARTELRTDVADTGWSKGYASANHDSRDWKGKVI